MNRQDPIVIVGPSPAGLRTAQALRREGHEGPLTIVGDEAHWPPFDRPPLSKQVLVGSLEPDRVRLRVPDDLDAGGRVRAVRLADGSTVEADVVVVGIGVVPNTAWLEGSGLTVQDGVVCDDACVARGGDGTVAAVGDVARWEHPRYGSVRIEHWTNAGEQAAHVAKVLVHGPEAVGAFAPVPYFWSDQFGRRPGSPPGRPSWDGTACHSRRPCPSAPTPRRGRAGATERC